MERTSVSTISRKPWGGLLEVDSDGGGAGAFDAVFYVGLFLRRFAEIALLACLFAVPLMYHWQLRDGALRWLAGLQLPGGGGSLGATYFFSEQLRPWLTSTMPVLESKFVAWALLGLLMAAGVVGYKLLEMLARRPLGPSPDGHLTPGRRPLHRLVPMIAAGVFLIYSLASFLFWAPPIPAEARAVLRLTTEGGLGGGGFFFSLSSWFQVAFGLLFFLLVEDMVRDRHTVHKLLGAIVLTGLVNAVTVVLLKVQWGPLMAVWFQWSGDDTRNNLGAFIGHNTGVSSFILPPLLIAAAWLFGVQPRGRRAFRIALAAAATVMVLALVLAQSRAVLPISILGVAALLLLLARRSCLVEASRIYVFLPLVLVAVLATQVLPGRFNPLYRRDVTLAQRIGEFRPERLLTETRLRILMVCATQLVPEHPVLGWGFGSFQYVYSKAQGEYFQANERSALAPTSKLTPQAHNEYLQTLVETGVLGLGIVLTGLFFLLRGGWLVFSRTLMPHHIVVQSGVLLSILGLLVHCAVDFPLRVPPLALLLVVLLAIWSAGDRLWLFALRTPREDAPSSDSEALPALPAARPQTPLPGAAALGVLLFGGLVGGSAYAAAHVLGPFQSSSTLITRGQSSLFSYFTFPDQRGFLDDAMSDLYYARRIYWIGGQVNRLHAQGQYFRATAAYKEARNLGAAGHAELAAQTRALAHTVARAALSDLNLALSEEQNHVVYNYRHLVLRLIAENSDGDIRSQAMAQAMEDLYRAVRTNPGDPDLLLTLIRILEGRAAENHLELVHYLGLLKHFHEGYFRERVYSQVLDALALGEFRDALARMTLIRDADPEDVDMLLTYTQALLFTGGTEPGGAVESARQILTDFFNRAPEDITPLERTRAELLQIYLACRAEGYAGALGRLERLNVQGADSLMLGIRYQLVRRLRPESEEAKTLRAQLLALAERTPHVLVECGDTAFRLFGDPGEAVWWLTQRAGRTPPMDLQAHVILAKAHAQLGQCDKALEVSAALPNLPGTAHARFLARGIAAAVQRACAPQSSPAPEAP